MKAIITALLLVSLARPAAAIDLTPYVALIVGQGADLVTTIHENPQHPCVETNALLGPHPSVLQVAIPKLAIIGGISLLVKFTQSRDSKAAKVIAKSAAYLGGVVGFKDGLHNYQRCW